MKHLIKKILKEEFLYKGVNPTVDLIVTRGDEILLIKRGSGSDAEPNKWALPGGFHDSNAKKGEEWVNNKETTLQAAKREVKEETGLEVDKIDGLKFYFVGVFEGGDRDPRDNEDSWTKSTVYKVDIPKEFGDDIKGMDDASKARWVPINIVLNSDLAFDHKDIIKGGLNQNLNESNIPKPGLSSAEGFEDMNLPYETEYLTLDEILNEVKNIAYYKEVLNDLQNNEGEWETTKTVKRYADYWMENPESLTGPDFPPIQVIGNGMKDGSHRVSTLNALAKYIDPTNPYWKEVKLEVRFYDPEMVMKQGHFYPWLWDISDEDLQQAIDNKVYNWEVLKRWLADPNAKSDLQKLRGENLNESDDFDWMEEIPGEAGYGTRYKFFEIHLCYEVDDYWTLDNPEGTDECVDSLITYIKIEESLADEIWSGYEGYTAGPADDGVGVIDYAIKNTKGNNFKEAVMVEYVKEINMENFCVAVGKEKENRKVCEIYNKYPYTNIDYFNESESNRSDFDWVDDIGEGFPLELLKPGQKFKDKWGDYIRIWEYEGQGLPIGPNILKFKIIEDPSNYRPYPMYPKKHSLNSGIIINKKDFKKHIRTGKLTPIFDNSVR